ncbi:MAG: RNA polymerase sigma factor [Bacteroidota bacterium]
MLPQRLKKGFNVSNPQLESQPEGMLTETVRRAQKGDRQAFEQLYRENVGRVYAVCLRIVANVGMAEELTQDAFVRAWEMLPSYRGEAAFSSWLHRLAVNVVLVDMRTTKRRTARIATVEDLSAFEPNHAVPAHGSSVDLEKAIASLPPKARTIFVLHDIEGYQHEEIAEQLGLATGTSKAQLQRARMLLRKALTS